MTFEEANYSSEEFKSRLFLLDDILNNSIVYDEVKSERRLLPKGLIIVDTSSVDCDEVFPQILLGNAVAARDKKYLKESGVTHVLNCAQGDRFNMVMTDEHYYSDVNIKFKGLRLNDVWTEDIARYFEESAQFIDDAINGNGKVLVHCLAGVSRSATIVIAYIMSRHKKPADEALKLVCAKRRIRPNEGFLKQLVKFDFTLSN